jgi:natural product biosynthesis luciferase-like monooxygenase protein
MSNIEERYAALSPVQRAELERRLKQKNLRMPSPARDFAPPPQVPSNGASPNGRSATAVRGRGRAEGGMQFSLFFFSDDGSNDTEHKYRLLIESVKFADRNGFAAVWTPERHFQPFGGLYPNPAVLSAALAVLTDRVQLRAGSVALPLHHPLRVTEEWAVVDNLSNGRVGVSFASGWHPVDFVLSPDAYRNRRETMFEHIQTIQRLWAGEAVRFTGVDGNEVELRALPRPLQRELPMWISISQSSETWVKAGAIGAHVLTAIVKQPLDVLEKKISLYRDSLRRHGHDPQAGQVAVMLHTFLGDDEEQVKELVRPPLCRYFRKNLKQLEIQTDVYANATRQRPAVEADMVTEEDLDAVAARAFESYYQTSLLCGTPSGCERLVDNLLRVGVNEIACLVDFGLGFDEVMGGLHHLNLLREQYSPQ